jgi:hypothetical protein
MPQVRPPPGAHIGLGELTTPGWATITLAWLARAVEAEYMEEALKPATARATTKVRMAMFFICVFLLGRV